MAEKHADAAPKSPRSPTFSPPRERRKICCDLGSGEYISVLSYKALPGKEECFDLVVQSIAHGLHHMTTGVSDVRVVHRHPPDSPPEATFIITFVSGDDRDLFEQGPQQDAAAAIGDVCEGGKPTFYATGHLMPDSHTFETLLDALKKVVVGKTYEEHDIPRTKQQMSKWFPRIAEYERFIHWDLDDPTKYTRNLLFKNENFELILMCWPPHSQSSIHCHDQSSCWVRIVEGEVWEVQYEIPQLDRKFIEAQMENPTGAIGRCGRLKELGDTRLSPGGRTCAYVNNTIGVHRVENRSDQPAYTLHCYAPGLRKMKLFRESGAVTIATVGAVQNTTEMGARTGLWGKHTSPDGVLDIEMWNKDRKGCRSEMSDSQTSWTPE
eukprot:TRINITY_DN1660_c0_g2_i1.p1 TRINITY_DN1660_c0_g2~~TRINITY_DN1660_c0_g2_i1.p1  ORF type:complete len:411 (+),score=121.97 TRINITY_DN1660_c0_g2_i1:96-1235(+)